MPKVTHQEMLDHDYEIGHPDQGNHEVTYAHTEGYSLMHRPFKALRDMMGE